MKKFSKLLTLAFIAGIGIFGSCKDCNEDMYQDMSLRDQQAIERIASLENILSTMTPALQAQIQDFNARIQALENSTPGIVDLSEYAKKEEVAQMYATLVALQAAQEDLTQAQDDIEILKAKLDALDLNTIEEKLEVLDDLTGVVGRMDAVEALVGDTDLKQLSEDVKQNAADLLGIEEKADEALVKAMANEVTVNTLIERLAELEEKVEGMGGSKDYDKQIDKLTSVSRKLSDAVTALQNEMKKLDPVIYGEYVEIGGEQKLVTDGLVQRMEKAEAVNDEFKALQEEIISAIQGVKDIKEYLKHQITSIQYQGVYDRSLGYTAIPTGVNGMLFALYGESATTGLQKYPKIEAEYEHNYKLTEADWNILRLNSEDALYTIPESGEYMMADGGASAGYIYFTLNPADVDTTDLELSLVNGEGEQVYDLANIKKVAMPFSLGSKTLREDNESDLADNGLWEAEVILSEDALEENTIHFGGLAVAIKNALQDMKNGVAVDFQAVRSEIMDLNNQASYKMKLNAVKALWSDGYAKHPVYSSFSYSVAAMKPASVKLFDGVSVSLADFIPAIGSHANGFDQISAADLTEGIDTVALENGIGQLAENLAGELNNYVNGANNMLSRIGNIIAKIYGPAFLGREIPFEAMMQPALFYATGDGTIDAVSNTKDDPTLFEIPSDSNAGVALIATNLNEGMITPAFKKFVGVSNVFYGENSAQDGAYALNEAALDANAASTDFCTVQDGNKTVFSFIPNIRDLGNEYTYEIVYSYLDYSGQSMTQKYYIKLVRPEEN